MAKRRPIRTLAEMEEEMGFRLEASTNTGVAVERLYSNLRPVPNGLYERTEKEYEEFSKRKHRKDQDMDKAVVLLRRGESKIIKCDDDCVKLTHDSNAGFYRFLVDIHCGFGFDLPLLFSDAEACRMLCTAKLHTGTETTPGPSPDIFSLPLEIRQKIYTFALPRGNWRTTDSENFDQDNFPRGIGDPSGFYYPLSRDLVVLRVNKQMRTEALPFAYRRTTFYLDDLDSVIMFLIAIGKTGRDNIESLYFAWEDSTSEWVISPDAEYLHSRLPVLHSSKCVQLLKQCKRLRHLCLQFESELILNMAPDAFMADPGIQSLCSLKGVRRLEIRDLGLVSLEHCDSARLLKKKIEDVRQKEQGDGNTV
ncbi:hypothetical protein QBC44DRAFT_35249 [Cladorrhinum sp. PSN332]|nr:hypothetical protein QBC44DRAFT_35249 [Cladorrhinum sp. PSN332]